MDALAFIPEEMHTSEEEDLIMSQLLANYCCVTNELNHQASSCEIPFSNFPSIYECSTATNMEVNQGILNFYSHRHRTMATNYQNSEFAFLPWDANATNLFLSQGEETAGLDQVQQRNSNAKDHEVVSENSKKRSWGTSMDHNQKNKRNVKAKSDQNPCLTKNIEDSCSSGDDEYMNADSHQDLIPKQVASLSTNCKARATRGLATDSQSTYARKRREKINARLSILQNLVPNGTKVDISTMLEDTVEYVKFLQLQIKLLSSDELWMYAPIINNGKGIEIHDVLNF